MAEIRVVTGNHGKLTLILLIASIFIAPSFLCAESKTQTDESAYVVESRGGLNFKVPEDWPLEKVGNAVGPVKIEEYLSKKFAEINNKLKTLEQQTNSFELRLRVLEEKKEKRLKSTSGETET